MATIQVDTTLECSERTKIPVVHFMVVMSLPASVWYYVIVRLESFQLQFARSAWSIIHND